MAGGKGDGRSRKGAMPGKPGRAQTKPPGISIPVLLVVAFCIAFAVYLGALEPKLYFQKEAGISGIDAYAAGNSLLLRMPHGADMSASAAFDGTGSASSISFSLPSAGGNVTELDINGAQVCSPCEAKTEYPVAGGGRLAVSVLVNETPVLVPGASGGWLARRAFFEKNAREDVDFPVLLTVGGGWRAAVEESMPSSFYGTDAPFHIHRVGVAAESLSRLSLPWASYTIESATPPALLVLLSGASQQYAFKLWEILVFFIPVTAFYLFSRKLPHGKDAVFLFASLFYLFLPSQGMLNGGGADLFMYGMVAHTLATSLSLFCLLFAYEFVAEGKPRGFWLSVLFCLLAVASNQRIAVAIGIGVFALFCLSLPMRRARMAILLGVAFAAASVWLVLPLFSQGGTVASYSVLGGASTEGLLQSVLGFFQLGYFLLPLFFAAGIAYSLGEKDLFALFLIASCLLVLVFATSQDANSLAPFLDGLRFMPSIFLPMFFISGMGAFAALGWARAGWRKLCSMFRLDDLDVSVTFALAVLMPLAALFASLALSAMDQYASEATSVAVAAEYGDLQSAYGIIGNECAVQSGRNAISFYPIYGEGFERTYLFDGDANSTVAEMGNRDCGYLLLGSTKMLSDASQAARWQEYAALASDARLKEIKYGGAVPLFVLRGAQAVEWKPPAPEKMPDWLPPLFCACAAAVLACGIAARKMGDAGPTRGD